MQGSIGELTSIKTGKLDANASVANGRYPFFTCSKETLTIDSYSYDCECVLVAGNGDLNVKYYNGKFDAYQRTYIIEDASDGKLYMKYLYWFMSSYINELRKQAIGGVIKYIKLGNLTGAKIQLPSIKKQMEIVNIITKVNNVLCYRESQLQKLDELIQARFVEMFGDPISNSLESNMLPMTDVCEIIDGDRGKNYPTQEEFNEKGYCLFLNAKNVTNVGFDFDKCMFITKQKDEILRKGKLCRGDVVLTTRGTIGNMAYYTEKIPFEHIRINSGMVILRMKHEIINEVFFIEQFKMQIANIKSKIASGSAQPQLPISTMNRIHILIPDINSQNQFADFVNQVNKSKLVIKNLLQIYKHQIQM